jgi:hypothetical protein
LQPFSLREQGMQPSRPMKIDFPIFSEQFLAHRFRQPRIENQLLEIMVPQRGLLDRQ